VKLDPMAAFAATTHRAGDAAECAAHAEVHDLRVGVRNLQTFNIAAATARFDFAIAVPTPVARRFLGTVRKDSHEVGIIDADTTLKLNKPNCARASIAPCRGSWRQDVGRGGCAAPDGRRRPGGHTLPRSAIGRTTTCSCGSRRATAAILTRSLASTYRAQRPDGAARFCRRAGRGQSRRAWTAWTASASKRARRRRARLRAGRPPTGAARRGGPTGMPASYTTAVAAAARNWSAPSRVRLGVPAVDRVHVYGARGRSTRAC
jgi:hypothetical protein